MKKVTFILGLLLIFSMSCDQDYYQRGTKQSYQARSNRLGGNENQTKPVTENQSTQPTTGDRKIYIVSGTAKTEMAAIQAARKFHAFGFESNVFRAQNGTYIITVGATTKRELAEKFLRDNIKQGKISDRSVLSYGDNWVGPIYAETQSNWQASTEPSTKPDQPESGTQNIYIPPSSYNENQNIQPGSQSTQPQQIPGPQSSTNVDAFSSGNGQFYLVISTARDESQALKQAQQHIRQGLTVFVYETSSGYAVTMSQAVSQMEAEAIRNKYANKISSAKLVPAGPEWKRQIFP